MLKRFPSLFLLVNLIVGICVGHISNMFDIDCSFGYFTLAVFILACISYFLTSYYAKWLTGLLIGAGVMLSGAAIIQRIDNNQELAPKQYSYALCTLQDYVDVKSAGCNAEVKIFGFKTDTGWVEANIKTLAFFYADTNAQHLIPGDILCLYTKLSEIRNAGNPQEFDIKKFYARNGILFRSFITPTNWKKIGSKSNIITYAKVVRRNILGRFENYISGDNLQVLSALTLGDKKALDYELKQTYAGAGAMHVLAVSGLHIGIIYLIFNTLLFFLDKNRFLKLLKVMILVSILWSYALITGFSPSVCRAALMFTFIIASGLLNRNSNIYNSLAASAFLLLLIDPYYLFNVGFQLSYLAVFGIVLLYKKISTLFYVRNRVLKWVWQMMSVSIAAQLMILPLAIYYFHQFSTYFALSSLIAVPMAGIIIIGSMVFLIFSDIAMLANVLGYVLNALLSFLNFSMKYIYGLTGAVIQDIYFDSVLLVISFFFIVTLLVFIFTKRKMYLTYTLGLLFVFVCYQFFTVVESIQSELFVVYNSGKTDSFSYIKDGTNYEYSSNEKSLAFYNQNFLTSQLIFENVWLETDSGYTDEFIIRKDNYFGFRNKKVLILNDNYCLPRNVKNRLKVDYLILGDNYNTKLKDLKESCDIEMVIISGSNDYWHTNEWEKEAVGLGISTHNVKTQGAFLAEF